MRRLQGLFVGVIALLSSACGSEGSETPHAEPDAGGLTAECAGEGEPVRAGLIKTGVAGYTFEFLELEPAVPLQSSKAPGNVWSLAIRDSSGAPASGTLLVSGSMPLHNNHPVSTPVAIDAGPGIYTIEDLLLPMPGLYSIALSFTSEGGDKDSVIVMLCMDVKSG